MKKIITLIALILLTNVETVNAMEVVNCGGLGTVPYIILRFIGRVINIIKIVVPIILIIMGIVDLVKATTASDEKQMQTSRKMLIKRTIYAIMVLFVISIVQLVFTILEKSVFPNEKKLLSCVSCIIGNDCASEEINITETEATSTGTKSKVKVTRVVITSKKTSMKIGDTYTIKAKAMPTNATDQKLTYKSSNTSVATISSKGKIKAKKAGTTTITVKSTNNKKNSFKLKIVDPLDEKREKVVEYAKKFVGNPYVYGGTSLTNGTDCSGFTMSVYKKFGYNLPRTSSGQSSYGKSVSSISKAKPGDLITYAKNGQVHHVALYIGNNKIVHAKGARYGIVIDNYNYSSHTKKIRRVIY